MKSQAVEGRVFKSTGSWYLVRTKDGAFVDCRVKGKFRLDELNHTNPVAVGDQVMIEFEDSTGTAMITDILPRSNYISRQSPRLKHARHIIASNLDQAFLIATIAHPRTSTGFIDRFLVTAEAYHIKGHLVFNKQDIFSNKEKDKQEKITTMYESIGYPVHLVSAHTGLNMEELQAHMKNKTTLLAGHSGVGKSTLINFIHPGLDIKTSEVSKSTQKGMHATTFAEMFTLPFGGYLIDTPGIKEFGILDLEAEEVSHYYPEMVGLITNCKFNNCLHLEEPDCAVKNALNRGVIHHERYKNYRNIVEDCINSSKGHENYRSKSK